MEDLSNWSEFSKILWAHLIAQKDIPFRPTFVSRGTVTYGVNTYQEHNTGRGGTHDIV